MVIDAKSWTSVTNFMVVQPTFVETTIVNLMMAQNEKLEGVSKHFTELLLVDVELFQSGPWWWTSRHCHPYSFASSMEHLKPLLTLSTFLESGFYFSTFIFVWFLEQLKRITFRPKTLRKWILFLRNITSQDVCILRLWVKLNLPLPLWPSV